MGRAAVRCGSARATREMAEAIRAGELDTARALLPELDVRFSRVRQARERAA